MIAQINSSWCVRVYRDELVEFQVDGTHGSAVAGLRNCRAQPGRPRRSRCGTRTCRQRGRPRGEWAEVPDNEDFDNGFRVQWEAFLRHVAAGEPFPWDFAAAARGVQLAELGLRAARRGSADRDPGAAAAE